MTEIAQLFETALRGNRSGLLRKAAMATIARMPGSTTLRDLLESDAAEAICELTLADLSRSLAARSTERARSRPPASGAASEVRSADAVQVWPESREERIYKQILDSLLEAPLTVGQLARRVDLDTEELRGYLTWMKRMGKVTSSGRARATRYHAPR